MNTDPNIWQESEARAAAVEAAAARWPDLTGGRNAVDWAFAIRRETVARLDETLRRQLPTVERAEDRTHLLRFKELVRAWMLRQEEAGFWIANRVLDVNGWFQAGMNSDAEIAAFVDERAREMALAAPSDPGS